MLFDNDNSLVFTNIKVIGTNLVGSDVLIGMDIIKKGNFTITNLNSKTIFSFQYYSINDIDSVKKKLNIK
jgi:hypothetical protein